MRWSTQAASAEAGPAPASPTRPSRLLMVGAVAAWVSAVGVQVASALVERPEPLVVVAATVALLAAAVVGFAAEWLGTTTGVPFGAYAYTGRLDPDVATVPLVVPLAWFAMGAPAYAAASAIIGASRLAGVLAVVGRAVVGAVALTAWDLFLDPQMVAFGYWQWAETGLYRGIPVSNYAGWLAVSFVLMLVFDGLLRRRVSRPARMHGLLGLYTSMTIVETVGFLGPLQFDPVVAACGGVAMGSVTIAAWVAVRRG